MPNIADDLDFDFDFAEQSSPGLIAEPSASVDLNDLNNLDVSDLTDMDEYETKIDLAKAYIDMGDNESAKAIAEEVLSNGSEQQKLTAKAILNEIVSLD